MKKTILLSILCLATIAGFAQDRTACKRDVNMPKGAVPAWPSSPYVTSQAPGCAPCYTYTRKSGLVVMECPFLRFLPDATVQASAATAKTDENGVTVYYGNEYTGNKPKVCKRDPDMPANARPVWPESPYVPTQAPECPPCYQYTSAHGIEIMECPYLRFLPENTGK